MALPLVTTIIPTYNAAHFVVGAVASALAQTYPAVEVVVVDDGSTDDTANRLARFGDRIRYLRQPNQGPSAARNNGIRAAAGEIVALLDADDLWHPGKLTTQVAYLTRHPDIGLLGTDYLNTMPDVWPPVPDPPSAEELPFPVVVMKSPVAPSTVVVRKSVFDEVGLFDTGLRSAEDWELWVRIAARFRAAKLTAPLVFYRVHPAGLSKQAERMEACEREVMRRVFTTYPDRCGWRMRRKTRGYAAYNSAFRYGLTGSWRSALGRILDSFWQWPFPYSRAEMAGHRFARPRRLGVLLLRTLGLRRPDPLARTPATPATA